MNWDVWPLIVLSMTLLACARPGRATLAIAQMPPSGPSRFGLMQAGGGAAMLTMAVYLLVQCRDATGIGYWDLPLLAVSSPYMRTIPAVWLPALCWACLVGLGAWWLLAGTRGMRTPRDFTGFVFALNEVAIVSSLVLWDVTVPETWARAALLSFALKGVYLSFLVGAAVRLALALASFAMPPSEPPPGRAARVNSSMRRF